MNIKSKFAAGIAALAIVASLTVPTSQANAGPKGWAIGAGVLGGMMVAGALSHAYAGPAYGGYYVSDYGHRRCRWERQYDSYGFYVGTARVCRYF
jgi:hypothetical protein